MRNRPLNRPQQCQTVQTVPQTVLNSADSVNKSLANSLPGFEPRDRRGPVRPLRGIDVSRFRAVGLSRSRVSVPRNGYVFCESILCRYININYRKNKYIRNFFSALPSLTPRLARPLTALPISPAASTACRCGGDGFGATPAVAPRRAGPPVRPRCRLSGEVSRYGAPSRPPLPSSACCVM